MGLKDNKSTIMTGAALIAVFSLVSRILGMYRDRIFSSMFGAGAALDAYYSAFRIPDTIFNLIVVGALSSAFIPVFTEYLVKYSKKEAFKLSNNLLTLLMMGLIGISVIIFFLSPYIIPFIAPGLSDEGKALSSNLTQIMLLTPIFFGISNIFSGILNSLKKFFFYSLAPVTYNIGIIAGTLILAPKYGVYGIAIGVVLGSFLHMLIQLPSVLKLGYRLKLLFDFTHEGVKRVLVLMGPRTLGLAVYQINLFVSTAIATTLAVGSVAIYNFANNLQSLPYSLFGISISTAAFPVLAAAASKGDANSFISNVSKTLRQILFFIIPVSILMLLLRAQIVRIVLGSGKFDWEDTILTASALGYFVLSLFAQSLVPLFAKAFYSIQNTIVPVTVSIISMVINIILALVLAPEMGVAGIALAFSVASLLNMFLLLVILHAKVGGLEDSKIIKSTLKILVASAVMGFVLQGLSFHKGSLELDIFPGVKGLVANIVDMHTFIGVFVQTLLSSIVGFAVFLGVGWLLKLDEMSLIRGFFIRLGFKLRNSKVK